MSRKFRIEYFESEDGPRARIKWSNGRIFATTEAYHDKHELKSVVETFVDAMEDQDYLVDDEIAPSWWKERESRAEEAVAEIAEPDGEGESPT